MVDRRGEQTLLRCSRRVNGTLLEHPPRGKEEHHRSAIDEAVANGGRDLGIAIQVSLGIRKLAEDENRSNRFFSSI